MDFTIYDLHIITDTVMHAAEASLDTHSYKTRNSILEPFCISLVAQHLPALFRSDAINHFDALVHRLVRRQRHSVPSWINSLEPLDHVPERLHLLGGR